MLFIPRTVDSALAIDGQDAGLKATEVWVQWIERHLDSIESIATVEHLQMNRRVLVPVEADEADLALLFRLGKGFENSIGRVNQFGVVVVDTS